MAFSRCCEHSEVPEFELLPDDQVSGLDTGMLFPMHVVSVADFLAMSGAPAPHQALQAKGVLRKWQKGMFVIFASHQWVSSKHPDPHGRQMAILRSALRNIMTHKVSVEMDVASQMIFNTTQRLSSGEIEHLKDAYIWLDWFAIPQLLTIQDDGDMSMSWKDVIEQEREANDLDAQSKRRKDMIAAVNSIPAYVANCDIFIVTAPTLKHESTGVMCNVPSWKERGWCRVELGCQALSQKEGRILVVSSSTSISFMPAVDWMFSAPGSGQFTVESDKEVVYPVMKQILDEKINHSRKRCDTSVGLFKLRFFTAMEPNLLAGLAPNPQNDVSEDDKVSDFLAKYQFASVTEPGEKGWGALMFACIEGNLAVVKAAVSAGVDVNSRTHEDNTFCYMKKGSTPLMVAAFLSGSLECIAYLLDNEADINAEDVMSSTALHLATWADRPAVVEMLIDRGMDFEKTDTFGSRPLHTCALFGRARAAEVLVRRGADVHPINGFGCTPLQCLATFCEVVDIARLMIENQAVVNYHQYPEAFPLKVLCRSCQAISWFKSKESAFVRLFAEIPGNNAIGLAAMGGMQELCEVLIKEGKADPYQKNDRGHDAFNLAFMGGHHDLPAMMRMFVADQ
jgi:ankyrin repeat protein